jgi:hypothetical protein
MGCFSCLPFLLGNAWSGDKGEPVSHIAGETFGGEETIVIHNSEGEKQ